MEGRLPLESDRASEGRGLRNKELGSVFLFRSHRVCTVTHPSTVPDVPTGSDTSPRSRAWGDSGVLDPPNDAPDDVYECRYSRILTS